MFEKTFKLREHGVTAKGELAAGLTTFVTMAYILAVNPQILGEAGMPAGGVLIATALSSFIACICMALFANLPFALAPGMGLNAYFTYGVVLGMGYSWQMALFAVFVEGIIFVILSLTNVREAIFNSIPMALKQAISCGIGLFIAFIGLQSAKLVLADPSTLLAFSQFNVSFHSQGVTALLAILGVLFIAILSHKRVKGAILIGIFASWILGMVFQLVGIYVPDPEAGFFSLYPQWAAPDFSGFGEILGQCFRLDFSSIRPFDFLAITFAFLFVDVFDTIGTLVGCATKADLLDEKGRLPGVKGALLSDSIGTVVGAVCGTSTVTTYVESSAGVEAGGRTGLTALTVGLLFLASIILSPIFISIPSFATAAALIYVGFSMFTSVLKIDFSDLTDAVPAYIALLAMPMFYSIAEGISFGIISYVIMKVCTGKKDQVSPLMAILALIFILRYIFM